MDRSNCNLEGVGVLVTRAVHQAAGLCKLIDELQGRPIRLPAVEICAPAQTEALSEQLAQTKTCDIAIFISTNAVNWGLKQLPGGRLPEKVIIAAVGLATAQALATSGHAVSVVPDEGFNSEALLATPELSAARVAGQKILIFRGEGGRQLLGETLNRRGASIEYAEVYRRCCPAHVGNLGQADWINDVDIITATSNIMLDNLFHLFGQAQREWLQRTPLVVISERTHNHAGDLGCRQVILAAGPDDRSIVEAICGWKSNR
ncbi:MAG: uroporphyrinogen-III synthase [Gammaproteobacteria bacterium]|nr:uroporphyrinogen-III synthase [Gammaproteobacteria bacterium]